MHRLCAAQQPQGERPGVRPGGAYIAIANGAASFVVAGWADAMPALEQALQKAGGDTTPLPVQVASHTPLMAGAVQPALELLRGCRFGAPAMPVLAAISGEPITRAGSAQKALSRQVAEPIRWDDCMDAIAEAGMDTVLELGPGAALARMYRARHPQIACRSVADFRTVGGLRCWVDG